MTFITSYDLREDIAMWYNGYLEQIYFEIFIELELHIKSLHVKIYDNECVFQDFVLEKFT